MHKIEESSLQNGTQDLVAYLKNIIALMPGHVYWKNRKGVLQGCNNEQASAVGLSSPAKIVGLTAYDTLPRDFADEVTRIDEEIMSTGVAQIVEETFTLPNGEKSTWLSKKTPLYDQEGKVNGILGISIDITLHKKLANELLAEKVKTEAANQKSQLISLLGDELDLPLTEMLSEAKILEAMVVLGKNRYRAENIINRGIELKAVIQDIIDYAEGQTKTQHLHQPILFDLKAFLEGMITSHQKNAADRGIYFVLDYPGGTPNWIHSDKVSWRKVFNYLISHIIHLSRECEIHIGIENTNQGKKRLEFDLTIKTIKKTSEDKNAIDVVPPDSANSMAFVSIAKFNELMALLDGNLNIEFEPNKEIKVTCHFDVEYNKNVPVINYPWSTYQDQVRILIVDNGPRGSVIEQNLGQINVERTIATTHVEIILRAAVALRKPFNIILVGEVQRGERQEPSALRLAKDIQLFTDIPLPMTVLFAAGGSILHNEETKQAGYFAVINSLMGPVELQKTLAFLWGSWCEKLKYKQDPEEPKNSD